MSELPASPYKGLTPFADTALDAMLFFGREGDVEIVCANVVASDLTVLYGPSGVGKSSLLAAAVARKLRELPERPVVVVSSTWSESPGAAVAHAVTAEAGVDPTDSLELAVERAGAARGVTYLLLDQAEEYFLYHPDGDVFERELATALQGPAHVHVLLSLREDALAKLDRFKASIPGILDNYLRLDRLSRASGRAAVEQPLGRWRELTGEAIEIEPELVEAVLDQVASGRIRGDLGGSGRVGAETVEERIEAPYLQLVLERLWEVEREKGSTTLRSATLEQLGGAAQIVAAHLERAMDALTPEQQEIASELLRQLVTPSGAKIAHAASDLAGYAGVSESETLGVLSTLAARRILRPGDNDTYEIYHDVLAAPILSWRARYVHGQELVVAHRRNRRLAVLATVALVAFAVTALVAVFALVQRSNARVDARIAHARELDATASTALATDPELSLLLARKAAVLSPTPTAEDVLRQAIVSSRVRRVVNLGTPVIGAVVVGRAVIAATADGRVVTAASGARRTVPTGKAAVAASFSRKGAALLTGTDGRLLLVSGSSPRRVPGVTSAVGAMISADGTLAAVRFAGHGPYPSPIVRLVEVSTGAVLLRVDTGAPATAASVNTVAHLLATGGYDHVARVWNTETGRLRSSFEGHVGPISAIAISPRGATLATASNDGLARLWSLEDGTPGAVLSGHGNFLTDIAFSPDGQKVVTASRDLTARSWKVQTGTLVATYAGDTGTVSSAAYAPSGTEVVTAGLDGTARVWDAVSQPELAPVAELGSPVTRIAFAAGGRDLDAEAGGRAYRIALPHGPAVDVGKAHGGATAVVGPGGDRAVITGKTVFVTHPDGSVVELKGHRNTVFSVAFSPDGKQLVTASADHDAIVWDTRTGAQVHVLLGHFAVVSDARFSPDARWIATAGPGTAGLWWAASGRLVYYLQGHEGKLLSVAFSPAGYRIATGGADGTVRTWQCRICGGIDQLVALADARLAATGRQPTAGERARYGL